MNVLGRYERELYSFLEAKHEALLADVRQKRELTDDVKARLESALDDFAKVFAA